MSALCQKRTFNSSEYLQMKYRYSYAVRDIFF